MGLAYLFEAQNLDPDKWTAMTGQLKSFKAKLIHDQDHRRVLVGNQQEMLPIGDRSPRPPMAVEIQKPSQVLVCSLFNVLESTGKYSKQSLRIPDFLDWEI